MCTPRPFSLLRCLMARRVKFLTNIALRRSFVSCRSGTRSTPEIILYATRYDTHHNRHIREFRGLLVVRLLRIALKSPSKNRESLHIKLGILHLFQIQQSSRKRGCGGSSRFPVTLLEFISGLGRRSRSAKIRLTTDFESPSARIRLQVLSLSPIVF